MQHGQRITGEPKILLRKAGFTTEQIQACVRIGAVVKPHTVGASTLAANRTDVTGGTATMIGWGSLWGTWAGIVTAVVRCEAFLKGG